MIMSVSALYSSASTRYSPLVQGAPAPSRLSPLKDRCAASTSPPVHVSSVNILTQTSRTLSFPEGQVSPLIRCNTYVPCAPSHEVPSLAAPRPLPPSYSPPPKLPAPTSDFPETPRHLSEYEDVSNSSLQTGNTCCVLQLNDEPLIKPLDGTSGGGRGGGGGSGGGGGEGMPQVGESVYPPQTSEYMPKTPTNSRADVMGRQGALQVNLFSLFLSLSQLLFLLFSPPVPPSSLPPSSSLLRCCGYWLTTSKMQRFRQRRAAEHEASQTKRAVDVSFVDVSFVRAARTS